MSSLSCSLESDMDSRLRGKGDLEADVVTLVTDGDRDGPRLDA